MTISAVITRASVYLLNSKYSHGLCGYTKIKIKMLVVNGVISKNREVFRQIIKWVNKYQ